MHKTNSPPPLILWWHIDLHINLIPRYLVAFRFIKNKPNIFPISLSEERDHIVDRLLQSKKLLIVKSSPPANFCNLQGSRTCFWMFLLNEGERSICSSHQVSPSEKTFLTRPWIWAGGMNPMTNIHRWAPGWADPSFPWAVKHWLVEVASYPPEQPFPTCMVGVQKLFSSGRFKHPPDFLLHLSASCRLLEVERTLHPPGSPAENHRPTGLATGLWILHKLISLHQAIYHMLGSRITWENLKHTHQCHLSCKEKHISSQHILQVFGLSSARITPA